MKSFQEYLIVKSMDWSALLSIIKKLEFKQLIIFIAIWFLLIVACTLFVFHQLNLLIIGVSFGSTTVIYLFIIIIQYITNEARILHAKYKYSKMINGNLCDIIDNMIFYIKACNKDDIKFFENIYRAARKNKRGSVYKYIDYCDNESEAMLKLDKYSRVSYAFINSTDRRYLNNQLHLFNVSQIKTTIIIEIDDLFYKSLNIYFGKKSCIDHFLKKYRTLKI